MAMEIGMGEGANGRMGAEFGFVPSKNNADGKKKWRFWSGSEGGGEFWWLRFARRLFFVVGCLWWGVARIAMGTRLVRGR
jgi:hypothetical protein